MNFHLEGQIVQVVVPLTDQAGVQVTPSLVRAKLYDGEGVLISDLGSITFTAGAATTTVTVLGALNTLLSGEPKEARRLDVEITHPAGLSLKTLRYGIEDEQSLILMKNSFQSFENALLIASDYVNLTAFNTATEARQKASLVEAFRRISSLAMIYVTKDVDGSVTGTYELLAGDWEEVNGDVFKTQFPTHFQRALRHAQVLEANELLQGNVLARKHAQGIATETIGESSVTLRPGFGIQSISSAARAILSGYINDTVRIERA